MCMHWCCFQDHWILRLKNFSFRFCAHFWRRKYDENEPWRLINQNIKTHAHRDKEGLAGCSASREHLSRLHELCVLGNQNQFMLNLKTASRSASIKIGNEHEFKLIQRGSVHDSVFSWILEQLIKPQRKAKPRIRFRSSTRESRPLDWDLPLLAAVFLAVRRS